MKKGRAAKGIRKLWSKETEFTWWLATDKNLKLVGDAIEIPLKLNHAEIPAGSFRADILACADIATNPRKVIIENQYGKSNHDHLGKCLTYASVLGAKIIVWIVEKARNEHIDAVALINRSSNKNLEFFLLEIVEAKEINSEKHVQFKIAEKTKAIKIRKEPIEITAFHELQFEYWSELEKYLSKMEFYNTFSPKEIKPQAHLNLRTSLPHCSLMLYVKNNIIEASIGISRNHNFFNRLYENKIEIEKIMECEIEWKCLKRQKRRRIICRREATLGNRNEWRTYFEWHRKIALKFRDVLEKYGSLALI